MSDLLFDTCFLIDLERELRRGAAAAHEFLATHEKDSAWISWAVASAVRQGMTPEKFVAELSHLSLAQVHDALSFYYDHREEVDRDPAANREDVARSATD